MQEPAVLNIDSDMSLGYPCLEEYQIPRRQVVPAHGSADSQLPSGGAWQMFAEYVAIHHVCQTGAIESPLSHAPHSVPRSPPPIELAIQCLPDIVEAAALRRRLTHSGFGRIGRIGAGRQVERHRDNGDAKTTLEQVTRYCPPLPPAWLCGKSVCRLLATNPPGSRPDRGRGTKSSIDCVPSGPCVSARLRGSRAAGGAAGLPLQPGTGVRMRIRRQARREGRGRNFCGSERSIPVGLILQRLEERIPVVLRLFVKPL